MMLALDVLRIFVLTAVVSYFWVLYFRFTAARRPHMAAMADLGIVLVSVTNVISYTHNKWMALPLLAGTYVGTWWSVKNAATQQVAPVATETTPP